jgi:hypothetical protein
MGWLRYRSLIYSGVVASSEAGREVGLDILTDMPAAWSFICQ